MTTSRIKQIVIIAGEESGDKHAAELVKQLQGFDESIHFTGIGGNHLQAAGVNLLSDLARHGVTGIFEVLRHVRVICSTFKAIKTHLETTKPDLLILVDYPGFNLRLAKFAKQKLGLRILYYISPQIWAWKANRIQAIRAYVDHMAVILPFEKKIYQEAKVPVSFVGHPLVENLLLDKNPQALRQALNLPLDKRLIALLPGSRRNEINQLLPILVATAKKLAQEFSDLHFVIPIARSLNRKLITDYFHHSSFTISFIEGQAQAVMACSDCVVVASGTASLECALLAKPMCIIYKATTLTYYIGTKLIKVKYLGLCNLLLNGMVVPELLQDDCNPHELAKTIVELLTNEPMKNRLCKRLQTLKTSLSAKQIDCTLAELVKNTFYKTVSH